MIRKILALCLMVPFFAIAMETCLVQKSSYSEKMCDIQLNGGGANWISKKIILDDKTYFASIINGNASLSDIEDSDTFQNQKPFKAKHFFMNVKRKVTNDRDQAKWECFKQDSGKLSICIPTD